LIKLKGGKGKWYKIGITIDMVREINGMIDSS